MVQTVLWIKCQPPQVRVTEFRRLYFTGSEVVLVHLQVDGRILAQITNGSWRQPATMPHAVLVHRCGFTDSVHL